MDSNQLVTLTLANLPTMLMVVIGMLLDKRWFDRLAAQMTKLERNCERMGLGFNGR